MKLKKKELLIVLILLSINFISAISVGNIGKNGINFKYSSSSSSSVNVNNSDYWQGHTGDDASWMTTGSPIAINSLVNEYYVDEAVNGVASALAFYQSTTAPNTYVPYSNANSNVNLGSKNITASFFIGNGSKLTSICLSNGTNCIASSGSMNYTNLILDNRSGIINGTLGMYVKSYIGTSYDGALLNIEGSISGADGSGYIRALRFLPTQNTTNSTNFNGILVQPTLSGFFNQSTAEEISVSGASLTNGANLTNEALLYLGSSIAKNSILARLGSGAYPIGNYSVYDTSGLNWSIKGDNQKFSIGSHSEFGFYNDGSNLIFTRDNGTGKIYFYNNVSNLTSIVIHTNSISTDDLAGIGFAINQNNPISGGQTKSAIVHQRKGSYGIGDIVFLVDDVADANDVNIGDESVRIMSTGLNVTKDIFSNDKAFYFNGTSHNLTLLGWLTANNVLYNTGNQTFNSSTVFNTKGNIVLIKNNTKNVFYIENGTGRVAIGDIPDAGLIRANGYLDSALNIFGVGNTGKAVQFADSGGNTYFYTLYDTPFSGDIQFSSSRSYSSAFCLKAPSGSNACLRGDGIAGSNHGYFLINSVNGTTSARYELDVNGSGFISNNFNISKNLTVNNLVKLEPMTLPSCDSNLNGNIGRNGTSVYYCNSTCWIKWGNNIC